MQLDARGPLGCCGSPEEAAPQSGTEPAQSEAPVTDQPGLIAPLEIPLVPVEPTEPEVPQAPKPEPITPPKVATPPIADAAKQAAAEAKGADLLAGKVPTKSFPPYTASYELKDQKMAHLSKESRAFLEVPLKGNEETMSSAFDQFAFYSKTPPKNQPHLPTFRAGFIKTGISVEYMGKIYDGTKKSNKIPTSELLAQGAKKANSKPTFVYMKKVANPDTKAFIQDALNEKGANDWTLSSTATEASEQKWFKTLLVCIQVLLIINEGKKADAVLG